MHSRRMLIVDDEKDIRTVLRHFFEFKGFDVWEASDGMEASETVREESFDLVLTDLRIPGPDGLEVLRLVKSVRPESVVLILTGYPSSQNKTTAVELGCDGFLSKPFRLEQLWKTVRQSLTDQETENKKPG
jgi:DNA-binding response OmpR family regulator